MTLIERIVAYCCKNAARIIAVCLLLSVGALWYASNHFAMDTNSETLISPNLPWRQKEARFDKLFPQRNNLILVVLDGVTMERAQGAANALAAKLAENKTLFPAVRRPDGGEFFDTHGILYLSEQEVRDTTQRLITAQPFLGALAADPSLRGVMDALNAALQGIEHGQAKLSDIDRPMVAFNDTLEKASRGKAVFLSWSTMFTGTVGGDRLRAFIEVQPKLDYAALSPGETAENAIRQTARTLGLTPDKGVRVRLTGPVPLADEEFATLAERADVMGLAMLLAVTFSLWLAVRSFRIIFCILLTLGTGLLLTTALGLMAVGVFNIISIAFIALFVGLGVDFAIQFSVRYRAARYRDDNLQMALTHAGRHIGMPLALAAAATAAGFFSFLPTDYVGVAKLGLVAGIGMVVAFTLAITLLPALIMIVNPPGEEEHIGFRFLAPLDGYMKTHRRQIVTIGALAALVCLAAVPFLKFDFNPLDLRSRHVESMATLFDLMQDPDTSPNTIDVLAPSLDATDALTDKLEKDPLIGRVLTLKSFVPEDQAKKLAMITDASFLLDSALNPFVVKPPPGDREIVASLKSTAKGLQAAAADSKTPEAQHARDLAQTLETLANGSQSARLGAANALIPGLDTLLDEMRQALQAGPVSMQTMPPDMVAEWVAKDGTARIEVFPKTNAYDNKSLKRFSKAVLAVTQEATGAPITIQEFRRDDRSSVHSGRCVVLYCHHLPVDFRIAPGPRRPGDDLAASAHGAFDARNLPYHRFAIELRQYHRPAAVVRYRRGVQYLFCRVLARGHRQSSAVEPDARGCLQRADHRIGFRVALAVKPSGHRQHGRIAHHLALLDAVYDAVFPARAVGTASGDQLPKSCADFSSSFFANAAAPPEEKVAPYSERWMASWLMLPFR